MATEYAGVTASATVLFNEAGRLVEKAGVVLLVIAVLVVARPMVDVFVVAIDGFFEVLFGVLKAFVVANARLFASDLMVPKAFVVAMVRDLAPCFIVANAGVMTEVIVFGVCDAPCPLTALEVADGVVP